MGIFSHIRSNLQPQNIGKSLTRSQANIYTAGLSGAANIGPGDKNDQLFGGSKRVATQKSYANEQQALKQQQLNRENLVGEANSIFGVGQSPAALANRNSMDTAQRELGQGQLQEGLSAADQNYTQGLTSGRASLARAGLIGSPAQGQLMADLGTQHTANVLGAQTGAQTAQQRLASQSLQQRLGLVSSIRGGQVTDTTGLRSSIAGLNAQSGGASVAGNVVGSFLPQGANAVSNQAQIAALKG